LLLPKIKPPPLRQDDSILEMPNLSASAEQ